MITKQIVIRSTASKQVISITNEVNKIISKNKYKEGLCIIFTAHTTCCLTTADLDPGTDQDMIAAFNKIIPNLNYRHPHDPSHVGDHIMSSIIGPAVTIPVSKEKLNLGVWQEIVLIELNGPKERKVYVNLL